MLLAICQKLPLESFEFYDASDNFTGKGLGFLQGKPLKSLYLNGGKITDESFANLKDAILNTLTVKENNTVTGKGFANLNTQFLQKLELVNCSQFDEENL